MKVILFWTIGASILVTLYSKGSLSFITVSTKLNHYLSFLINKIFFLFHIYFSDTFPQSGAPVRVLVNQQATLFRNVSSCENAQFRWILPTEATIAKCQKQICDIKDGFLEKFQFKDNILVLKSAKYSDWGTYECDCKGFITFVKWDVVGRSFLSYIAKA